MFESPEKLLLGLVSGVCFGFFLQRAWVAKPHVVIGQLLLRDWTVAKVMATAVLVGSIGIYALGVDLSMHAAALAPVIVGAVTFGTGLAILGLCPGTTVAGAGEGQPHAYMGLVGMFTGASLYVWLFPWMDGLRKALPNLGKVSTPQITETSPWLWIALLAVLYAGLITLSTWHWRLPSLRKTSRRSPA